MHIATMQPVSEMVSQRREKEQAEARRDSSRRRCDDLRDGGTLYPGIGIACCREILTGIAQPDARILTVTPVVYYGLAQFAGAIEEQSATQVSDASRVSSAIAADIGDVDLLVVAVSTVR